MRARVSILAWASTIVALALLGACGETNACRALKAEIQTARSEGVSRASHLLNLYSGRTMRARLRVVEEHDFFPTAASVPAMSRCLGADWQDGVEGSVRTGWREPGVVFERASFPVVVLLHDGHNLQILIEVRAPQ